jgi:hypothetical protein
MGLDGHFKKAFPAQDGQTAGIFFAKSSLGK